MAGKKEDSPPLSKNWIFENYEECPPGKKYYDEEGSVCKKPNLSKQAYYSYYKKPYAKQKSLFRIQIDSGPSINTAPVMACVNFIAKRQLAWLDSKFNCLIHTKQPMYARQIEQELRTCFDTTTTILIKAQTFNIKKEKANLIGKTNIKLL